MMFGVETNEFVSRFPKWTNETIKDTLSSQFAQLGAGRDKKWAFVSAA